VEWFEQRGNLMDIPGHVFAGGCDTLTNILLSYMTQFLGNQPQRDPMPGSMLG
jgi:hypothetical protein